MKKLIILFFFFKHLTSHLHLSEIEIKILFLQDKIKTIAESSKRREQHGELLEKLIKDLNITIEEYKKILLYQKKEIFYTFKRDNNLKSDQETLTALNKHFLPNIKILKKQLATERNENKRIELTIDLHFLKFSLDYFNENSEAFNFYYVETQIIYLTCYFELNKDSMRENEFLPLEAQEILKPKPLSF